jgi:hypothetical protein
MLAGNVMLKKSSSGLTTAFVDITICPLLFRFQTYVCLPEQSHVPYVFKVTPDRKPVEAKLIRLANTRLFQSKVRRILMVLYIQN